MKKLSFLFLITISSLLPIRSQSNSLVLVSRAKSTTAKVAGERLATYSIVYQGSADWDEGSEAAARLRDSLKSATGETLPTVADTVFSQGNAIHLIPSTSVGTFNYTLRCTTGQVYITGGSSWAFNRAVHLLCNQLRKGNVSTYFSRSGTVTGNVLFDRYEDANLRILDDNIWQYDSKRNAVVWQNLNVDCRNSARGPQFAQLVRAYMPEVVTLQEYSSPMDAVFYPLIRKYGYTTATAGEGDNWNYTPVFYDTARVTLLESGYHLYTPSQWSNAGTKSYTYGVFTHKETGKRFIVFSTHLWWKSESAQAGSDSARYEQVNTLIAKAEELKLRYDCPIFVCGDMNSYETSIAIKAYFSHDFTPCYKVATGYADNHNGHHVCSASEGFSRVSKRKADDRSGAIDHCLVTHAGTEMLVRSFDCLMPYFTVKLTDHYPNLIDIKLQ